MRGKLFHVELPCSKSGLKKKEKNRSDNTPDPGGHRPQCPCAQGRTCAKQDQAQASALGQNRTQFGGGATTHGRRTKQAGREKRANSDTVGGWRVHTAVDTPRRNAATRSKHLRFMCQGDIRPRAAAGSSRNGTTQAVAAATGTPLIENADSNTASAWSGPEHTRNRSHRRRASASGRKGQVLAALTLEPAAVARWSRDALAA